MTQNDTTSRLYVTFRRWWPLTLAGLVLGARASASPEAIENKYSRGLFPILREIWDHTLAFSPVPLFYVFWLSVILGLVWLIRRFRKERSWGRLGRRLVNFLALLVATFLPAVVEAPA
ncbi:MAG: hypothetical protein AAFN92_19065, partial [Bacteroidota bacterium]